MRSRAKATFLSLIAGVVVALTAAGVSAQPDTPPAGVQAGVSAQPDTPPAGVQDAETAADGRREKAPLFHGGTDSMPWARMVGGTALVIGLICFGVYALKKLNGGLPLNRGRHLELLEARPLGRKVQLFLVRVAGRVVLLASTGENVTRVAEFAGEELPEPDTLGDVGGLGRFGALLKRMAGAQK